MTPQSIVNTRPGRSKPSLLRHSVLDAYPGNLLDGVSGVQYYGARVIASSFPGDVVQLHPDLADREQLDPILKHYERVGLAVPDRFVFDENWSVKDQHPDLELDAFYFGQAAHAAAPDQSFFEQVRLFNNKNWFIQQCWRYGVPTPGTILFDRATDFVLEGYRQSSLEYPVYVKAARSASGMHVIRCENERQLLEAIELMPQGDMDEGFQIQEGLLPDTVFLNMQYVEHSKGLTHGPLTRQKLDGNAHAGNIYPSGFSADSVQPITDKVARVMSRLGMKRSWAIDIAMCPLRGVLGIEANPRWNGASYYSKPAERLGVGAWEGQYVKPKIGDLRFILNDPSDWEYSRARGNGIVIINWGPILGDPPKLGLLVVGDPSQRTRLLQTFEARYCNTI
tara:strand:+ start:1070 stop:2251 length:1182 start_codon:yes stop_codon:yes gene_type:complete